MGQFTDVNGNFTITVPNKEAILAFSYVGFITLETVAGNQANIRITLREAIGEIDEVVVGYGIQKKVNLTGAITVADQKKLENRPITTASQALQGLNGLHVNQNTGQPGNDQAIISP